jgi:hypothetical protein
MRLIFPSFEHSLPFEGGDVRVNARQRVKTRIEDIDVPLLCTGKTTVGSSGEARRLTTDQP